MEISSNSKCYSIAKAGIWYTVGNLIIKGLPFFTLLIFVRILSTSDFGLYNAYISYENILSVLLGLGFSGTVKTAKFDFEKNFEKYISSLYFFLIIFCLLISPLIIIGFNLFDGELMNPLIVGTLIIHSFSNSVFTINGVRFVILGKYKTNIVYTFINTILNITISLFFCLHIFNNSRYVGRIMGTAVAFAAVMLIIVIIQQKREKLVFNKNYIKYALKMGIPLIPHLVSVTLLSSCDKIMIQNMIGNTEAGIYSLSVNLVAVLSVFVTSIENAWSPWFYSSLKASEFDNIKQRNDIILLIFAYLSCGFMLIGPELIKFFSTDEYTDSIYPLVPLAVSVFLNFIYLIPVNLEYYKKKTGYISAATTSCAIINLILNYFFIRNIGYIYAAHATCISKGVLLVFRCFAAKKLEKHSLFSMNKLLVLLCVVIVCGIITLMYSNSLVIRWSVVLAETVLAAYFFMKNKKFISRSDKQ